MDRRHGRGLRQDVRQRDLALPAEMRLGFRELGLAIGLRESGLEPPLAEEIIGFRADHRKARTWTDHLDIDEVMLATALLG